MPLNPPPPASRRWLRRGLLGGGCVAAFLVAAHVASGLDEPADDAALYRPAAVTAPVAAEPAAPAPVTRPAVIPALAAAPAPTTAAAAAPAALQPADYAVRSVLTVPRPFTHGKWVWDDARAPADGRIVVTVDLKAEVLSVFRGGHEIGSAVMIYGADEKPTPLGVFNVSFRKARHTSSIYNAPMPYTLRLTNDGVAIHGSATMRPDSATHGCVGVPVAFARKLFDVVKLGDVVIVTNGERLDVGQPITAVRG